MFKIEEIENPKFLENLNYKELNLLAKEIRSFIIENVSITGGHLSSNLGSVELTIALHKVFNASYDKILFDVGHQAYTHKILTGRAKKFKTLRQYNGLSGFLKSIESPYDIFESGHSSTSISTAMGMAIARKENNQNYQIVDVIGDASIANGIAFEALNNLSTKIGKIIIILNDNDMSISKSVGALAKSLSKIRTSRTYGVMKKGYVGFFSKIPLIGKPIVNFTRRLINRFTLLFRSANLFDNFEMSYLGPIDGHNIKALVKAFKKAKNYNSSILVHVKTKKGFGYVPAENDCQGKWHGTAPFDIEKGEIINNNKTISYSQLVANNLYKIMKDDENINLISAAMVSGSFLNKCFTDFSKRCFDVGIAEEHAICLANGLALSKKTPIVSLYSTFLQRGYDEILHDIARINSKVLFLIDRAGIVGADGSTHQGIFDVSFLSPIKNVVIATAPNAKYVYSLIKYLLTLNHPTFFRYEKIEIKDAIQIDEDIDFTKFLLGNYHDNNLASLIVVGDSYNKVLKIIKENNYPINVLSPFLLKPIDETTLSKLTNKPIYIYDNTSIFEGFSSSVLKYINSLSFVKFKAFTLPNEFIPHGKKIEILDLYKLKEEDVISNILKELGI